MRHFAHHDIDIDVILNCGTSGTSYLSETISDIFIDSGDHIYEYANDELYGTYGVYQEATDLLRDIMPGITTSEIKAHKDSLESDILQALSYAYRGNCEVGFYSDLKAYCLSLEDDSGHNYVASGHYPVDERGVRCSLYECAYIRFYITKKDYQMHYVPFRDDYTTQKAWLDCASDNLAEMLHGQGLGFDWKHFDYHGGRFDCEGWQALFKEFEETSHSIKQARGQYCDKVKRYIKSNTPLIYREGEASHA